MPPPPCSSASATPSDSGAPGRVRIRPAGPGDIRPIHALVRELARFEKLEHEMVASPDDFHRALFGERPIAEALVAETTTAGLDRAAPVVGFALFFTTFSTFTGKPSLYLEDVFVIPEERGTGVGKALLQALARTAEERGCGRIDWTVLDWNAPAIAFYERMGAALKREWILTRLEEPGIRRIARDGVA